MCGGVGSLEGSDPLLHLTAGLGCQHQTPEWRDTLKAREGKGNVQAAVWIETGLGVREHTKTIYFLTPGSTLPTWKL